MNALERGAFFRTLPRKTSAPELEHSSWPGYLLGRLPNDAPVNWRSKLFWRINLDRRNCPQFVGD